MRATEFVEKVRIIHVISEIFNNVMNKTKVKKLVDAVFETSGEWIANFEYVIYQKICGDLTGLRQGTDEALNMRISFILDDRNYIIYTIRQGE